MLRRLLAGIQCTEGIRGQDGNQPVACRMCRKAKFEHPYLKSKEDSVMPILITTEGRQLFDDVQET